MDKASLAAIGFCVILSLLTIGFLLDAVSQFHATGQYKMPDYVLEYVRLALSFAFGGGVFAAIREARRVYREKQSSKCDSIGGTAPRDEPPALPSRGGKEEDT